MVDNLADKLHQAGKITEKFEEYGLFQRLTKLEEAYPGSNILLFKSQKMPKSFQNLWCNERLLNIMEQILGPEVAGHPVWNLRTKTPNSRAVDIPWHQDSAYFSNESYDHMIATAWIPFLDATEENGCMQVARNGHRKGKVATHQCCAGPTWYVMLEEEEMKKTLDVDIEKDILTLPIKYGGFLLFNNITPHRSLMNYSDEIRWSVDLRCSLPSITGDFTTLEKESSSGLPKRKLRNPTGRSSFQLTGKKYGKKNILHRRTRWIRLTLQSRGRGLVDGKSSTTTNTQTHSSLGRRQVQPSCRQSAPQIM